MIIRSTLSDEPFVFRIVKADAGDRTNITSEGDDVKLTQVDGVWSASDGNKVFYPAENMIALPNCTQIFVGKETESATVDVDGVSVTKFGGDGGYYYMNKRSMPVVFNDAGTVVTFWHKDKKQLNNRTIHIVDENESITFEASINKQKYIIVGGGTGTVGEDEITAIKVIEVNVPTTYNATTYSTLMEIEI